MVTEVSLEILTAVREQYERGLASLPYKPEVIIEQQADRDLVLTCCVVYAKADDRRLQISVDPEAVPCAFLKRTGVDYELSLLHIIATPADPKIGECRTLFNAWLVERLNEEVVAGMASKFPT